MGKLSDLGLFASRFNSNTIFLTQFDEAVRYFKRTKDNRSAQEVRRQTQKLLQVLIPVSKKLAGNLTKTMYIDDQSIIEDLHKRNSKNWQQYRNRVIQLSRRLAAGDTDITSDDFKILNDVADAIDNDCATIFRRMSGRL